MDRAVHVPREGVRRKIGGENLRVEPPALGGGGLDRGPNAVHRRGRGQIIQHPEGLQGVLAPDRMQTVLDGGTSSSVLRGDLLRRQQNLLSGRGLRSLSGGEQDLLSASLPSLPGKGGEQEPHQRGGWHEAGEDHSHSPPDEYAGAVGGAPSPRKKSHFDFVYRRIVDAAAQVLEPTSRIHWSWEEILLCQNCYGLERKGPGEKPETWPAARLSNNQIIPDTLRIDQPS